MFQSGDTFNQSTVMHKKFQHLKIIFHINIRMNHRNFSFSIYTLILKPNFQKGNYKKRILVPMKSESKKMYI